MPTDKYFGFIKDPKIKEKVAYFLMDHLRVGGAEYAHINRSKDFDLIGADSLKLHKENVDQYHLSATKKEAITKDLKALEKELKSLVDSRFPKELKKWLKTKRQFDSKKLDLFTYLGRTMPLLGKHGEEKGLGLISFILEAMKTNDPAVIEKAKHIDAREVFAELIKLEKEVAATYLHDGADKQLLEYYKILSLLGRLNELQVSQEEYEAVKTSLKAFDTDSFAHFVFSQAPKTLILSKMWERNIKDAIRFYEIAAARDGALSGAFDRYFSTDADTRMSVLVYGGFHKEKIKRILEAKKISYLVVSPRITKPSPRHEAFYKQLMSKGMYKFEVPLNLRFASRVLPIYAFANGGDEVRAIDQAIERGVEPAMVERYLLNTSEDIPTTRSEMRALRRSEKPDIRRAVEQLRDLCMFGKGADFTSEGKIFWKGHIGESEIYLSPDKTIIFDATTGVVVNLVTGKTFKFDVIETRSVKFSKDGTAIGLLGAAYSSSGQSFQRIDLVTGLSSRSTLDHITAFAEDLSWIEGDRWGSSTKIPTGGGTDTGKKVIEPAVKKTKKTQEKVAVPPGYSLLAPQLKLELAGEWAIGEKTFLNLKEFFGNPWIAGIISKWGARALYVLFALNKFKEDGTISSDQEFIFWHEFFMNLDALPLEGLGDSSRWVIDIPEVLLARMDKAAIYKLSPKAFAERFNALRKLGITPTPALIDPKVSMKSITDDWNAIKGAWHGRYLFKYDRQRFFGNNVRKDLTYNLYKDQRAGIRHWDTLPTYDNYLAYLENDPRGKTKEQTQRALSNLPPVIKVPEKERERIAGQLQDLVTASRDERIVSGLDELLKNPRGGAPVFTSQEILREDFLAGLTELLDSGSYHGFLCPALIELKQVYGGRFWEYWPLFVEQGMRTGSFPNSFFSDGLIPLAPYVSSADDLRRIGDAIAPRYNTYSTSFYNTEHAIQASEKVLGRDIVRENLIELITLEESERKLLLERLGGSRDLKKEWAVYRTLVNSLGIKGATHAVKEIRGDWYITFAVACALGEDTEGFTFLNNYELERDRFKAMDKLSTRVKRIFALPGDDARKVAAAKGAFVQFLYDLSETASDPENIQKLKDRLSSHNPKLPTDFAVLGDRADPVVLGSKTRGQNAFAELNLPYAGGISISGRIAARILDGAILETDESVSSIVAVRSAPEYSMPGMLETETQVSGYANFMQALRQVASSWNLERARNYRGENGIAENSGFGIMVQRQVHTYKNANCAAGVVFSHDPDTGLPGLSGQFAVQAKGADIVSGKVPGLPMAELKAKFPAAYEQLEIGVRALTTKLQYPQDIEFGIEDGQLYFLQTRDVEFALSAGFAYITSALENGLMSERQAAIRKARLAERAKKRQVFKIKEGVRREVLGHGAASIPSAMAGNVFFDIGKATGFRESHPEEPVILVVTKETREAMLSKMTSFPRVGLITSYGGPSSHEAVVCRAAGIPVIINIPEDVLQRIRNEKYLAIDGKTNEIFVTENMDQDVKQILEKDGTFTDMTFGTDPDAYMKEFTAGYLAADGTVRKKITLNALIDEYVAADIEFFRLKRAGKEKEAYLATLRQHCLHLLIPQKAKKDREEGDEIGYKLENTVRSAREDFVRNESSLFAEGDIPAISKIGSEFAVQQDVIVAYKTAKDVSRRAVSDPDAALEFARAVDQIKPYGEIHLQYRYLMLSVLKDIYKQLLFSGKTELKENLLEIGRILNRSKKTVESDMAFFAKVDVGNQEKAKHIDNNEGLAVIRLSVGYSDPHRQFERLRSKFPEGVILRVHSYQTGDNHVGFTTHYVPDVITPVGLKNIVMEIIASEKYISISGVTAEQPDLLDRTKLSFVLRSEMRKSATVELSQADTPMPTTPEIRPMGRISNVPTAKPWQGRQVNQDAVFVIPRSEMRSFAAAEMKELLFVAWANPKLRVIVPDGAKGGDSRAEARIEELSKLCPGRVLFSAGKAAHLKAPWVLFGNIDGPNARDLAQSLGPRLEQRLTFCWGVRHQAGKEGFNSFGVPLLAALGNISRSALGEKNGFLYDPEDRFSEQIRSELRAYTVISMSA